MESAGFIRSIASADLAVCENADSFLQSAMWGRFKSRFGWTARAFLVDWDSYGPRPLLALCRKLAPGLSFAYIPWGPELPADFPAVAPHTESAAPQTAIAADTQADTHVAAIAADTQAAEPQAAIAAAPRNAAIAELAHRLRPFLPKSTAFIRFDPPWFAAATEPHIQAAVVPQAAAASRPPELPAPFKRAAADIQPPDTVLIDLSASAEEILAAMKPKWRYNIGLAEKRNVIISRLDEEGIEIFYKLLTETAKRDGIAIHSIDYYRALFDICRDEERTNIPAQLRLYAARHEEDTLAAIVVLCRGTQAVYLYGASSNIKRNLMAPYALQWEAMQDAKAFGCTVYDLFGIPPTDDPEHPMAGLYRFKTGFGGAVIHRPGSWDYPLKPALCGLFNTAEKLRKKARDKKKKHK